MDNKEIDLLYYRKQTIDEIRGKELDLLVIGGGIIGAGITRDAILRGYSVALIEKNDFGYGTSSGSSKIVHAGIRYLAQREYRLVREGSLERKKIIEMAPHLSRPIQFILPTYSDMIFTVSKLRKGVWLYDLLANFRNYTFHKILNAEKAQKLLPSPIREENFQGAVIYGDGLMDDARLTLDVILSAEEHGAHVLNYCEAISFNKNSKEGTVKGVNVRDKLDNKEFEITARTFVFACGHWTDLAVQNLDPSVPKRVRPTKGIHIITRRIYEKDYVLGLPIRDGRIFFICPFGKYNLIGTTDTDYKEDYDFVPVLKEDIEYIIEATNFLFPDILKKEDIVSAYSGIRPLIVSPNAKSESDVSRKHEIFRINPNVFAIAGGKYTTFRSMSKELVDQLTEVLGIKGKCRTDKVPLYGWVSTKRKHWDNWAKIAKDNLIIRYNLHEDIAQHLLRYGKNYVEICELMDLNPLLRERISENRPYILAEIDHQVKNEKAVTLNDIMFRRTQLQLSNEQGMDCVENIANRLAEILGWSSERKLAEISQCKNSLVWKP
ncbi:MAG: glycerol-3-phosphate dehydrogenase/oxidase [Promethearchaeota archaeon]